MDDLASCTFSFSGAGVGGLYVVFFFRVCLGFSSLSGEESGAEAGAEDDSSSLLSCFFCGAATVFFSVARDGAFLGETGCLGDSGLALGAASLDDDESETSEEWCNSDALFTEPDLELDRFEAGMFRVLPPRAKMEEEPALPLRELGGP